MGLRHVPTEDRRPDDNDCRHAEKAYESDKIRHFNLHGWSGLKAWVVDSTTAKLTFKSRAREAIDFELGHLAVVASTEQLDAGDID